MVCEARDEKKTSRLIPLLLVSRTMEIYESLGLADEIKRSQRGNSGYFVVIDFGRCYDETSGVLAMETLTLKVSDSDISSYT